MEDASCTKCQTALTDDNRCGEDSSVCKGCCESKEEGEEEKAETTETPEVAAE
jgi:hypothetical protein